jgi:KR domain
MTALNETNKTIHESLDAKLIGAYHLHELSRNISTVTVSTHGVFCYLTYISVDGIKMFVATSSISEIGERASAAYSAANTGLAALVDYRHKLGLPAFAARFGPISFLFSFLCLSFPLVSSRLLLCHSF